LAPRPIAVAFVLLWTHAEHGWMLGIPSAAAGIVYEGTTLGDVLALDELDGRCLALDGNTLFVAGRRALWAYRLQQ
jgi:hypothetical protein